MKSITIRSQIMEVANKWRETYGESPDNGKSKVQDLLNMLDKRTATANDVKNIIGNSSWACWQKCNECGLFHGSVVELGEAPDYESATIQVCFNCLKKAMKLISK